MSTPADHADPRPFTGQPLDRASVQRKDPAHVRQLLEEPAARAVGAGSDGVLLCDGSLLRFRPSAHSNDDVLLLGLEHGRALFAVDLDSLPADERTRLAQHGEIVSLRELGATLPHAEAGLAAYLTALLNWHRRHRFCANCGAATAVEEAGYSRRCPRCGAHHFPRTDPVVIMAVEHQRRLLLGRRAGSPTGRYSVLAGFVSPGESAEEAVIREVREESGILVRDTSFVGSQPWPFPSSLMLGFEARAHGGDPQARDGELEDVRWFSLEQVAEALSDHGHGLLLPPRVSIARFLIERWVARQRA